MADQSDDKEREDSRVNQDPSPETEQPDRKESLEDEVDEASDESFPASDPPSY